MGVLLFESGEWSFDSLKRTYDAIEEIAVGEMGLDPYPNQIELISAEQMLDAYSSIGIGRSENASPATKRSIARATAAWPTRS